MDDDLTILEYRWTVEDRGHGFYLVETHPGCRPPYPGKVEYGPMPDRQTALDLAHQFKAILIRQHESGFLQPPRPVVGVTG